MVIALLNAPTRGGAQVIASFSSYMRAVRPQSAIPYLAVVGLAALALGGAAASSCGANGPTLQRRQA